MNFVHETAICSSVKLGKNIKIFAYCNVYGCKIGDETTIGFGTEVQAGASIGKRCKISSNCFVPDGTVIESEVFIAPGVVICNDKNPRACKNGKLKSKNDWKLEPVIIKKGAAIGANSTLLPGVKIGKNAIIGAGSVVTKNVPANEVWAGNPAKHLRKI